ncbi:hypothetical protein [Caulobacter henricii]|uniref:Uncharacterized protein n=1 Tax=Caulobacter henricii TaxID=69395 RepID=A0A0P0P331_9CAUL|nr:hypothetical protein [Caulobacter henricii]ALL14693.1 hypothetical protein AQ619_15755 [Caulobacter henricii]
MSAFEFFFTLFGLILGMAVAVVIGGLSDLLRTRNHIPIGRLTPMLAVVVLFDVAAAWISTWTGLSDVRVAHGPFFAALIVAGLYFFAASMVFPKDAGEWPSLDDYFMHHRRAVLGSLLAANVGVVTIEAAIAGRWMAVIDHFTRTGPASALWWLVLALLLVVPGRRVQGGGLAVLIAINTYAMVALWNPR